MQTEPIINDRTGQSIAETVICMGLLAFLTGSLLWLDKASEMRMRMLGINYNWALKGHNRTLYPPEVTANMQYQPKSSYALGTLALLPTKKIESKLSHSMSLKAYMGANEGYGSVWSGVTHAKTTVLEDANKSQEALYAAIILHTDYEQYPEILRESLWLLSR